MTLGRDQVERMLQWDNPLTPTGCGMLLAHDAALRTELAAVRAQLDKEKEWMPRCKDAQQQLADLQGKLKELEEKAAAEARYRSTQKNWPT